jgi:hypothetical protein
MFGARSVKDRVNPLRVQAVQVAIRLSTSTLPIRKRTSVPEQAYMVDFGSLSFALTSNLPSRMSFSLALT